jgi:hypothetical protein
VLGVRPLVSLQVIKAGLHLLVDHAGAEIREAESATVAEAIEETMAPITLAVRVVLMTPCGNVGIHARLRHGLPWVTRRRRAFFTIPRLGGYEKMLVEI